MYTLQTMAADLSNALSSVVGVGAYVILAKCEKDSIPLIQVAGISPACSAVVLMLLSLCSSSVSSSSSHVLLVRISKKVFTETFASVKFVCPESITALSKQRNNIIRATNSPA